MGLLSPLATAFANPAPPSSQDRLCQLFGVDRVQLAQDWSQALQACLLLRDIGQGDDVILSALAPPSLAHAIGMTGARPVFVDVDSDSLLASQSAIERALSCQTKAVVVSHLYGQIYPSATLYQSLSQHGILLIEDGSDAFLSLAGSPSLRRGNKSAAQTCDFLIACPPFSREREAKWPSFILSNNHQDMDRLAHWSVEDGDAQWLDIDAGSGRFFGLLSHLGEAREQQFNAFLDELKSEQKRLAQQLNRYHHAFVRAPIRLLKPATGKYPQQSAMPIHVPPAIRDDCFERLCKAGFRVFHTYRSLSDLSYFKMHFDSSACPNASRWARGALSLPTGALMGMREQALLIDYLEAEIFPHISTRLS